MLRQPSAVLGEAAGIEAGRELENLRSPNEFGSLADLGSAFFSSLLVGSHLNPCRVSATAHSPSERRQESASPRSQQGRHRPGGLRSSGGAAGDFR